MAGRLEQPSGHGIVGDDDVEGRQERFDVPDPVAVPVEVRKGVHVDVAQAGLGDGGGEEFEPFADRKGVVRLVRMLGAADGDNHASVMLNRAADGEEVALVGGLEPAHEEGAHGVTG